MARYFHAGLLAIAIAIAIAIGVVALFPYRTSAPQALPVALETSIAEFGDVSLRIEYATTTEARENGLSGRASIPSDYGMLFVFPKEDNYGFWMKDTLVPLDIFWLDDSAEGGFASGVQKQLVVVSFKTDVLPSSYPHVFYPSAPARYVLETVAGFAREHQVATGTSLLLKNLPNVSK